MSNLWLNRIELIGNLGHGAELRYTTSQTPVLSFDIASTEPGYEKRPDETTWFKCVVYGKLGEIMKPKMTKGTQVFICGQIAKRKWKDKENRDRESVEVVVKSPFAHQLIVLHQGRPQDSGTTQPPNPGNQGTQTPPQGSGTNVGQSRNVPNPDECDSDLPF